MPIVEMTPAEKLFIRRRRTGETQAQAAQKMGVTEDMYHAWEIGRVEPPKRRVTNVTKLTPLEECVLERRRQGITQRDLAVQMKISRRWLVCMERGTAPATQLLHFWGK